MIAPGSAGAGARPRDFGYCQARMQARYGERPSPSGWQRLGSSRDLGRMLEAAHASGLGAWLFHLHEPLGPRSIERGLGRAYSMHVEELSGWVPEPWAPAFGWLRWLPWLEQLESLARDASPPIPLEPLGAWLPQAPARALERALAADPRAASEARRSRDPAGALEGAFARIRAGEDAGSAWIAGWHQLRARAGRDPALALLQARIGAHREQMRALPSSASGWPARAALLRVLEDCVRRDALRPAAAFAYLGCCLLDLERLRAALLDRALFGERMGERAWA